MLIGKCKRCGKDIPLNGKEIWIKTGKFTESPCCEACLKQEIEMKEGRIVICMH